MSSMKQVRDNISRPFWLTCKKILWLRFPMREKASFCVRYDVLHDFPKVQIASCDLGISASEFGEGRPDLYKSIVSSSLAVMSSCSFST